MFQFEVRYLNEYNIWEDLTEWTRPIKNKSTLDETHDESQIFLSCSNIETPFKPFTKFIIQINEIKNGEVVDSETLYRVVIADEIEQVVFSGEELYDHNIRLAEATKELERYTVDNLSFTNEWRKAFQTSENGAYITNQTLGDGWYNYANQYINRQGTLYFPNMFSAYNSFDAYYDGLITGYRRPGINGTLIAKTLYANNYEDDFEFDNVLLTSYLQNSSITIPTLTLSSLEKLKLAHAQPLLWQTEDYYAEFRQQNTTVKLISPNGTETTVTQGNVVQLDTLGKYKLIYTTTRQVRLYRFDTNTWSGNTNVGLQSSWFNGLTTTVEIDIMCVASSSTIPELSIYDVLNKLIQVTPTRYNDSTTTKYRLDSSVFDKYAAFKCPELIITNKNLWEALKQVGGLINAIPYLNITDENNWNVIAFFPLSSEERVSDNVEENYCNSESYYDSENFTASFDMTVDNLINPVETNEGFIKSEGYYISKTPRSEEAEISLTSMDIETTYPIYKINTVKYIDYDSSLPQSEFNIEQFINEKALYNTLVSDDTDTGKSLSLYYTQGQPNIYGLQYKVSQNQYSNAIRVVAIKNILIQALIDNGVPSATAQSYITDDKVLNAKFVVDYIPYLQARIKLFKTNAPKIGIDTSMFQNTSMNVIDAHALGRKNVAVLGRIGNLGYTDSIKVYHLNKIPLKGQRASDGYFVGTVFTEYDQEHILCSIEYTKDYQKISDYVGIENLQRYFEVSEKQAINRFVNTNMFYVFYGDETTLAEIGKEKGLNQASGYPALNYMASLLVDQGYNRKINGSILTAYSENNGTEFVCSKVYLNTNAISVGNSICLITDYMDNYGAGYQAVDYTRSGTQAYMNKAVPYSDKYGKIKHLKIQNVTDSNISYPSGNNTLDGNISAFGKSLPAVTNLDNDNYPVSGTEKYTIADSYQNDNKPTFSLVGCEQDIILQKDSREIIRINQQHHFLTASDDVIIGSAMTESCRFIQNNTMKARLVFLKNKIDTYEFTIKNSDIISIVAPSVSGLSDMANSLISLGTQITNSNLGEILSTTNNTDELYIQPNISYSGAIVGLQEDAEAWAIITDENKLIIGKNEKIKATSSTDYESATQINMKVTSVY